MRGTAASLVRPTTGPRHRALNFTQNSPSLLTDEPSHERHLPKTAFPARSSNAPAAPQRSVSYGDGFCTGDAWRQRHKAPQSLETEENVYGQNRHHHRSPFPSQGRYMIHILVLHHHSKRHLDTHTHRGPCSRCTQR